MTTTRRRLLLFSAIVPFLSRFSSGGFIFRPVVFSPRHSFDPSFLAPVRSKVPAQSTQPFALSEYFRSDLWRRIVVIG